MKNCINSSKYEIDDLIIPLESQPFLLINKEVGVLYHDKSKNSVCKHLEKQQIEQKVNIEKKNQQKKK